MRYLLLFLILLVSSAVGLADQAVKTRISDFGINSNGEVFVTFIDYLEAGNGSGSNCRNKQLALPSNSALKKEVLSIAITAFTTNSEVVIKPKGCFRNHPTFSGASGDWGWFTVLSRN